MRLIDADALAHDLEYDVELCARVLDDMNMVGKEREDMQWQKDCKQNCIWYISEQPTVDAIPIQYILTTIREWNRYGYAESAEALEILVMNWDKENTEWAERKEE